MTKTKPRGEEEEEALDRLSNLPDHIIHRIFWLLDIRYAIQTCVLSKRWRYLWASLPDLKFKERNVSAFKEFVCKVLVNRDNNCSIGRVELSTYYQLDQSLLDTVINYAVSHRLRELYLGQYWIRSLSLPPALLTSESLKEIEFYCFEFKALPESFGLGFTNVTTLHLKNCQFHYVKGVNIIVDPFANCPHLTHLCLRNCYFSSVDLLKITGLQLLNLQIEKFSELRNHSSRVEVYAPKLLNFWFEDSYPLDFSQLYLPCLAYLEISPLTKCSDKRKANLNLINMFEKLGNTPSLWLHPQTFEVLDWYPQLLQQKPSRLRFFTVPCMLDSFTVPAHVASYCLGSTVPMELTHVEYLKNGGEVVRTLCYRSMVQA